jgi:hypothetical protein
MAKDIKFDIKLTVDGKEKLVTAATDAKNCVKQLDESHSSAIGLRHTLFDTHDIAYTADFGRAETNYKTHTFIYMRIGKRQRK